MEQIEDKEFKWYMVSTVSGKEENVIEALKIKLLLKIWIIFLETLESF